MSDSGEADWIDTLSTSERRILDLRSIGMRHALTLGQLRYHQASPPLPTQAHANWLVLVFVLSGQQRYVVDGQDVIIRGGETLRILPGRRYGTGSGPEQKGHLAWLILKVRPMPRGPALGMSAEGVRAVFEALSQEASPRVQAMSPEVARLLADAFQWWDRREEALAREVIRNRIAALVLGIASTGITTSEDTADDANRARIERVLQWITAHPDAPASTSELAERAGLSPARFHVLFKKVTGSSPKDWLLRHRVERAAERLRQDPELSVTTLAHDLGFSSSQYFATVFRRYLGVAPRDYRR